MDGWLHRVGDGIGAFGWEWYSKQADRPVQLLLELAERGLLQPVTAVRRVGLV